MKTFIIIKDQFPALHAWDKCPFEEVKFLRWPHRHMFHVTLKIRVTHDDRDVEFFMVKNQLSKMLHDLYANRNLGSMSCEMLCKKIRSDLRFNVDVSLDIHSIIVSEDNENAAEVVFD
jgi:hypothetical protein